MSTPQLTLNSTLNTPLGQGAGTTSNVPFPFSVALNGRGYLVDLSFQPWKRQAMRTTSIDQNRTQADTSGEPGEATLNPEALWRRSQDTWNHGSNQTNLDRKESDIAMFRSSKGINPWNLWQMTLHPDTQKSYTSANTNLEIAIAGGYVYVSDGTNLEYSTDLTPASPTFTATTGMPGTTISSLTSDGYNVYAACGTNGVYQASQGTGATQLVPLSLDSAAVVGFTNNRLMLGNLNSLYNILYQSLVTPTGLTVTPIGTTGGTTYGYRVSAINGNGETLAEAEVTTSTGNASLSGTNYNSLTWNAQAGATGYNVYGRTSGAELFLATVTTNSYNDTGAATPGHPLPLSNTTGTPSPLLTHRLSAFRWVGFAEGNGWIYAAGNAGSQGYVYAITVQPDGSALSAPVIAAMLPTGETVQSIQGYLGFIIIGTSLGFRVAVTVSNPNTNTTPNGTLTLGPLIPLPNPPLCFDGQDRFVYFGWTNFDSNSTGIGRMDLTQFPVLPQAPAFASDLMSPSGSTVQGSVTSITYFQNLHCFAVSGQGIFAQHPTNFVPSGFYQSGLITYDIADQKIPIFLDIQCLAMPSGASIGAALAEDGGLFNSLGSFSVTGGTTTEFQTSQIPCSSAEVQVTLNAPGTPTATPTLRRTTLRAVPAAVTGNNIFVPIRLADFIQLSDGPPIQMDPAQEWGILESLRITKQVVTYQEGSKILTAYVADIDWIPEEINRLGGFNGIAVVNLKQPV